MASGKPEPWTSDIKWGEPNNEQVADVSINEFAWAGNDDLVVTVDEHGANSLWRIWKSNVGYRFGGPGQAFLVLATQRMEPGDRGRRRAFAR